MEFQLVTPDFDRSLADLIRYNLKKHGLDIPGTVYFDDGLDHLSEFYLADPVHRAYFILAEGDKAVGGIGLAEFDGFPDCAELQKLYLADEYKGQGLGYMLIARVEEEARRLGYQRIYLETHTNLQAALHIYEKTGYEQIERPSSVIHSTMNRFYLKEL